jgi:hypothetical protein
VSATRYLIHLEILRILKEPDPAVRTERLLPYFLLRCYWDMREEARDGLVGCGVAAGPYLMGAYESSRDDEVRHEIMLLWGKLRYAGAVDTLIKVLDDSNKFWAIQDFDPSFWKNAPDSTQAIARNNWSGRVYYAVTALGEIGSSRARPSIEESRRTWATTRLDNAQIVEACDHAVATLDQQPKR